MISIDDNSIILAPPTISIREALKRLDKAAEGILFIVTEGRKLLGTLTDGDIRRSLLLGRQINESIEGVFNVNPCFIKEREYKEAVVKKMIQTKKYAAVPIVNDEDIVVSYEKWDELIQGEELRLPVRKLEVPVVVMAGGKGTRMAPFTNVLPKPLIPVGGKTILELIIDEFKRYGIKDYYVTINYRGEMIKAYFDYIERDYDIKYIKEEGFLGTAGSLVLLPEDMPKTFIVSNCDIIVKADFSDVLEFHNKSGALLTVISAIQHHKIPYGVIKFENGGVVTELEEKPEMSFCINTGVYVLDSKCIEYIPRNEVFHMTHLMERLIRDGKKVVTYPVNESEYIDIGQWDEYRNALTLLDPGKQDTKGDI